MVAVGVVTGMESKLAHKIAMSATWRCFYGLCTPRKDHHSQLGLRGPLRTLVAD